MKFLYYLFFINIILLLTLVSCFSHIQKTSISDELINKQTTIENSIKDITIEKKYLKNKIFVDNIKTPLLFQSNNPLSLPIINLVSDEELTMSFDDLDGGIKNYYFSVLP